MFDKNTILVSGSILFREGKRNKDYWLLIKQKEDDDWEFPKSIVRRGESSVRTGLRIMGEKGGMSVKVIEEGGRTSGAVNNNGKITNQKIIYYLMYLRSLPKDIMGYYQTDWLEYPKAVKKIKNKKEIKVFRDSYKIYKEWKRIRKDKRKRHELEEGEDELVEFERELQN